MAVEVNSVGEGVEISWEPIVESGPPDITAPPEFPTYPVDPGYGVDEEEGVVAEHPIYLRRTSTTRCPVAGLPVASTRSRAS